MKSGWDIKKLGEVCELIADGDWIESKDQSTCGIRLVQTGNVGVGIFRNKEGSEHFVSSETFRRLNCTEIFGGDILISRLPDPVGRACVVPDLGQKMITAVDCSIVRLRRSVCLPTFLVYYASSAEWFNAIEAKCTGSTRKRISRKNLTDVLVPIPPLSEQKRIVAKIDAALEKIDKLKANAEKNLANAKELFQSALDEAMRPKDGCNFVSLTSVSEKIFAGGDKPEIIVKESTENIKIPIYSNGENNDGLYGYTQYATVVKPAVTVSARGTIGFCSIRRVPYVPIVRLISVIPNDKVLLEYLYYSLKSLKIKNTGSSIPQLTVPMIKEFHLPMRPLSEQREIVNRLDLLAEKIKMLEQNYTQQIADCAEMRQSVLREAFEGRL